MKNRLCGLASVFVFAVLSLVITHSVRGQNQLRILSYNVHHCQGVDGKLDVARVAKVIASVKPDLVALQEIDRKTTRSAKVDQAFELGKLTGLHSQFAKNIAFQGGEYGNAVLSRWPIVEHKNHLLPNPSEGEQRGILQVVARSPELGDVIFCATHLDHRRDPAERLLSARRIGELFGKRGNAIIAGDLNDTPGSETLAEFAKHWRSANAKPLPTVPVARPARQIDFVLLPQKGEWRVRSVEVLKEAIASDHRPIFVVLERN